ncbi:MAG: CoA transferase [Pseudomonadales bacterium]|nr:CoA transferase [Pseudomonadales bacterium]MDP6971479.1 CoA transferase [Pseudomonadales bacterium]
MHFITPALLDYTANGNVQARLGNRDLNWAPHGAYPVSGEDQFIALACETDEHWRALCTLIPALDGEDPGFLHADQRLARQDELDETIAAYTRTQDGYQLEQKLQAARVPASVIQNSPELVKDPQLAHFEHFIGLPHHEGGETVVEAARIHMSRSNPSVDTSAPTFSRDMMFVLNDVLGYDDEKIGELLVSGALE